MARDSARLAPVLEFGAAGRVIDVAEAGEAMPTDELVNRSLVGRQLIQLDSENLFRGGGRHPYTKRAFVVLEAGPILGVELQVDVGSGLGGLLVEEAEAVGAGELIGARDSIRSVALDRGRLRLPAAGCCNDAEHHGERSNRHVVSTLTVSAPEDQGRKTEGESGRRTPGRGLEVRCGGEFARGLLAPDRDRVEGNVGEIDPRRYCSTPQPYQCQEGDSEPRELTAQPFLLVGTGLAPGEANNTSEGSFPPVIALWQGRSRNESSSEPFSYVVIVQVLAVGSPRPRFGGMKILSSGYQNLERLSVRVCGGQENDMQIRDQWKGSRNWKRVTGAATAATLSLGALAIAIPGGAGDSQQLWVFLDERAAAETQTSEEIAPVEVATTTGQHAHRVPNDTLLFGGGPLWGLQPLVFPDRAAVEAGSVTNTATDLPSDPAPSDDADAATSAPADEGADVVGETTAEVADDGLSDEGVTDNPAVGDDEVSDSASDDAPGPDPDDGAGIADDSPDDLDDGPDPSEDSPDPSDDSPDPSDDSPDPSDDSPDLSNDSPDASGDLPDAVGALPDPVEDITDDLLEGLDDSPDTLDDSPDASDDSPDDSPDDLDDLDDPDDLG